MVKISKRFIISLITVFLFLNLLSITNKFLKLTQNSKNNLQNAITSIQGAEASSRSLNLEQASQDFATSKKYFTELESQTWIFDNKFISPDDVSEAGTLISQIGEDLIQISSDLKNYPEQLFEANKSALQSEEDKPVQDLTSPLASVLVQIQLTQSKSEKAIQLLQDQSYRLLPSDFQDQYEQGLKQLRTLDNLLKETETLLNSSLDLLGHQTSHRYLVLLQNQNELRPLGGFLGGVISFEIDKGVISKFQFTDIYDIDGQSTKTLPTPPEFKSFTVEIFSRDANYTPSLKHSAEMINELHQSSKQSNHRTFISLNHTFLEKLLNAAGPLQTDRFTLTADNFSLILNTIVEVDQNKNIVGETISKLQSHILQNTQLAELAQVAYTSVQDRDLQFYTQNQDLQNILIQRNILPQLQTTTPTNQDHLLITQTNIGGNKSDKYIKQEVIHTTDFPNLKDIQNTIQITRTHTYSNQQEIINESILRQNSINPRSLPDGLRFILGRGDNKNATKLYIPKGSELISFQGAFESEPQMYFDEFLNQNYILFTQVIAPGETKKATITYKPNLNIQPQDIFQYEFLNQKPSGYKYEFTKTFQGSKSVKLIHSTTPDYKIKQNRINFPSKYINQDTSYSISISEN